jgi:hypothetical protein
MLGPGRAWTPLDLPMSSIAHTLNPQSDRQTDTGIGASAEMVTSIHMHCHRLPAGTDYLPHIFILCPLIFCSDEDTQYVALNRYAIVFEFSSTLHRLIFHVLYSYVFSTSTKIILSSASVTWPLNLLQHYVVHHVHEISNKLTPLFTLQTSSLEIVAPAL